MMRPSVASEMPGGRHLKGKYGMSRRVCMVLALLGLTPLLGGWRLSKEDIAKTLGLSKEDIAKNLEKTRKPILESMAKVIPRVTPAHLAECKQKLESAQSLLGAKSRLVGPLRPHVKATCVEMGTLTAQFAGKKEYAAYMAPVQVIGGLPGGSTPRFTGCLMVLSDNVITVQPGVSDRAPRTNYCHYIY